MPNQIAVVTGAGAGIGRATVRMLASYGFDIALLGRNRQRLHDAAAELEESRIRTLIVELDVSDADAVSAAAERVERELGAITVWINAAGIAAIGPVLSLDASTLRRVTEVTYLGSVFGTQAALACMRRRGCGTIVNLGIAYPLRGLPMQAAVNGAHAAIAAFCDSVRPEIRALSDRIDLTMVYLPSINTPRLGWSRNRSGHALKPAGRIYEPEVAAHAICQAVLGHHRDIWVGASSILSSLLSAFTPTLRDRLLARRGFAAQFTKDAAAPDDADILDETLTGAYAAHGPYEGIPLRDQGRKPLLLTKKLRVGLGAAAITFSVLMAVMYRPARRS
ncbi:SDR family oxidoreductase [Swaminathania salitolerans]|uniref:Short-chain dehydrogenase n=1 Tax=Swaminathania salitolerans TaxID=182838 RepID=A0A511BQS5_9PROT|nr:SDR family oxidoreductase [Swaminathania salitolerans]GBQ11709.1 oxidoreductase [Swaminathania salitolerans LMG 21291]GEL02595.1 short-chain dehydrogenase [Swaminathania salitolerans]